MDDLEQEHLEEDDEERLFGEVDAQVAGIAAHLEEDLNQDDDVEEELELQLEAQLSDLVQNELVAPDLLPSRLFSHLQNKIQARTEELFAEDAEEKFHPLERSMLELDCKRWEFELVALHRARLQKISRFSTHFLRHRGSHLSLVEHEFATEHEELRGRYLKGVFLNHLPQTMAELDSTHMPGGMAAEQGLHPTPDLSQVVLCKVSPNKDLGEIRGEEMRRGTTWACAFANVSEHVMAGDVCLM